MLVRHKLPFNHWLLDIYSIDLKPHVDSHIIVPNGYSYILCIAKNKVSINSKNITKDTIACFKPTQKVVSIDCHKPTTVIVAKCIPTYAGYIINNEQKRIYNLNHLISSKHSRWSKQLFNSNSDLYLRIQLFNSILSQLNFKTIHKTILDNIVLYIHACKGKISIKELTQRYSCSARYIQKQFKSIIGITPKVYLNLAKLYYTLLELEITIKSEADVTILNYYYDHSHFSKTVKSLLGVSYSKYKSSKSNLTSVLLCEDY
ncbi:helix-turn-helix domain-containing protein [Winogradskyella sp. F6397]|uniref:Helix-turn-helix domain-containing protein n=1 Tax=Winogradskyella marina TaxID=2785530 RepID=A0ABS0EKY8_9FLAO|nr:helix-turn-helix domain-containing protein [Winogradskyella marina]MBF8149351.1 helix-turn-helix domain-containing protein [Winogradskyella marina]